MSALKKHLTPVQLAERLEGVVTVGTLANWRARKPNPGPSFVKLGGRVLYPVDQVEAWEARNLKAANDNEPEPQ